MAATQWIVVTGVVQPGYRVASGQGGDARYPDETLRLQFPKFAALGLDLTGVLAATLNVSIQPRRWIMHAPRSVFLAPNAKLRSQVVPVPPVHTTAGEGDCNREHSAPARMTWARLLKRVFDIDIEQCQCGGKLKLIAVIDPVAARGYIGAYTKRAFKCASTNWQVVVGGSPIRGRNGELPWP